MCLAFPQQIVKINGNKAKIRISSQEQEIDISLVKVRKGDFVLVQNNTAIRKIPQNQIKELTALFTLKGGKNGRTATRRPLLLQT